MTDQSQRSAGGHEYVLAFGPADREARKNGERDYWGQISVHQCTVCYALVVEDFMPEHEAWHRRRVTDFRPVRPQPGEAVPGGGGAGTVATYLVRGRAGSTFGPKGGLAMIVKTMWLTNWWPLLWRVGGAIALAYVFLLLLGMPQIWDWTL